MVGQKQGKKGKRPRRSPHSGRARGSEIRTGNAGARRTRLTEGQKIRFSNGGLLAKRQRHWSDYTTHGLGE